MSLSQFNSVHIWPEGMRFTKVVDLPTKFDEPLPVKITFIVPPFDVVVETYNNTEPAKAFGLFRRFLVDWNQQDKMTDAVLADYLAYFSGSDKAIFQAWFDYVTEYLDCNLATMPASNTVN